MPNIQCKTNIELPFLPQNSLCESVGYSSLVASPTVDCASPLPHASGQLSIALHHSNSNSNNNTGDNNNTQQQSRDGTTGREEATGGSTGKLTIKILVSTTNC